MFIAPHPVAEDLLCAPIQKYRWALINFQIAPVSAAQAVTSYIYLVTFDHVLSWKLDFRPVR